MRLVGNAERVSCRIWFCAGTFHANAFYCQTTQPTDAAARICMPPEQVMFAAVSSHLASEQDSALAALSLVLFKLKCLFNGFAFHSSRPRHMSPVCLRRQRRRRLFGQGLASNGGRVYYVRCMQLHKSHVPSAHPHTRTAAATNAHTQPQRIPCPCTADAIRGAAAAKYM